MVIEKLYVPILMTKAISFSHYTSQYINESGMTIAIRKRQIFSRRRIYSRERWIVSTKNTGSLLCLAGR
jgi:hypothetical protein